MDNLEHYPELLKVLQEEHVGFPLHRPVVVGPHVYQPKAFVFLMLALKKAAEIYDKVAEDAEDAQRHLTGRELLEGVRQLGLEMFGPLTQLVFGQWGVHRTEDWGEIVFALVENGILRKTDRDSRADFAGVYDFATAFRPSDYWQHVEFSPLELEDWPQLDSSEES